MFMSWYDGDSGNAPHEVMSSLYLGSAADARNRARLNELSITHILTAAKAITPKFRGDFQYMVLDVDDWAGEDLLHYFESTNKFIDEARQKGRVLVHCLAGVSRSSTVTIAYVMYSMKIPFEPAYALVKKARPCISPNPGFLRQLQVYERWCFGVKTPRHLHPLNPMDCSLTESNDSSLSSSTEFDTEEDEWETSMCMLLFKLELLAKAEKSFTFAVSSSGMDPAFILAEKNFHRYSRRTIKPDPKFWNLGEKDEDNESPANHSDILGKFVTLSTSDNDDDALEYEELWVDIKPPVEESLTSHLVFAWVCKGCDKFLFTPLNILYLGNYYYEVEVMSWMKGIGTVTGSLECSKCKLALGDFDWQGMKNDTGLSVPVFRIMKKYVEKKEVEILV